MDYRDSCRRRQGKGTDMTVRDLQNLVTLTILAFLALC